ncbi:MAG: hypothetical protein OEZ01_13995 [Candidatus Heimdallarchaeota archaeon]|nr:hypothetical protein [Candidatus Heimdallarchaeota archaeon]MDH5647120.1 hypothetical protein [Candidatus Heimdallarchaeota archaeon]
MKYVFLLLIGSSILFNSSLLLGDHIPSTLSIEYDYNIAVTLINYDESLVDLQFLRNYFGPNSSFKNSYQVPYNFSVDINFANESYTTLVNDYIDSQLQTDWTTQLNITALEEQKQDFKRKSIFKQINGTAINASNIEEFLSQNKPTTTLADSNLYHIYIFNLSRLDFGNSKHWFNVTEVDPDSGKSRINWRLEWDDPLNLNVKFPYPAYSSTTDISFLDPTAHQWYLQWRAIWNEDTEVHDSYYNTLRELIHDKTIEEKREITTTTLSVWLYDWIGHIYGLNAFHDVKLSSSVDTQITVVYDSQEEPLEKIQWITNQEFVNDEIGYILNSQNVNTNISYVSIRDDDFIKSFLDDNEVNYTQVQNEESPFEGYKYYSGTDIFEKIFVNTELNQRYFGNQNADTNIRGLIFLLDNASYVGNQYEIPWTGGLYTGLGSDGVITILYELDRAFMPGREERKSGLSKVFVHEIGHSVGLPHTFSDRFISDFIADVMGYYPGTSNFTKLISLNFWRTAMDQKTKDLISEYQLRNQQIDSNHLLFSNITDYIDEMHELHGRKDFIAGYQLVNSLLIQLLNLDVDYIPLDTLPITPNENFINLSPILWLIPVVIYFGLKIKKI